MEAIIMSLGAVENSNRLQRQQRNRMMIQIWLYSILIMCLAIVIVGGATRMTGSGLSITEWKPIHGIIPPIGMAQWQEEFEKYQQIAQYKVMNQDMTLTQFKGIFWWEWGHRVLARLVGMVALFGLLFFWLSKKIEKNILLPLVVVPFLIAFQGVIGWWMVASGLGASDLTSVSQYRLAIHLVAACIVVIFVTYVASGLKQYSDKPTNRSIQRFAGIMVFLILLQIYFGALVAGLHAGKVYNSWPLMDGQLIPSGMLIDQPLWRNFFENSMTVQFIHRSFAYLVLIAALYHAMRTEKLFSASTHARRAQFLLFLIILQAVFGIVTLLTAVPISWGLIHQGFALLVLCFSVAHWRATKGAYVILAK